MILVHPYGLIKNRSIPKTKKDINTHTHHSLTHSLSIYLFSRAFEASSLISVRRVPFDCLVLSLSFFLSLSLSLYLPLFLYRSAPPHPIQIPAPPFSSYLPTQYHLPFCRSKMAPGDGGGGDYSLNNPRDKFRLRPG